MPIKEESFRIGCGRYVQGAGYISKIADEVLRCGRTPLVVGGKTALSIAQEKIEQSLKEKCNKYEFIVHTGTCNDERAKEIADYAKEKGFDVIVGVGGGVICDFAKVCGYFAKLPTINVPTSSATCAAYTPLSVRYTPDGRTVGSLHYEYEVDCVLVDTEIMAHQPVRLFLAGVFDSLAKFVEIKHRFTEDTEDYPIGLDYAYAMSKYSYKLLDENTQKCIDDMEKGEISHEVDNIIFTTIAATGVISGIARGSNQTALAHKFYETTRLIYPEKAKPYLHGEIVGVGLLLQNYFNGEEKNNNSLTELMKKYNMPSCVTDVGIEKNRQIFEEYYEHIVNSSAIDKNSREECEKFRKSLEYLWML